MYPPHIVFIYYSILNNFSQQESVKVRYFIYKLFDLLITFSYRINNA